MKKFPVVLQETVAPAEEKPSPAEASAPVKAPNEVAQSGVSLSISKGDDHAPPPLFFFSSPFCGISCGGKNN